MYVKEDFFKRIDMIKKLSNKEISLAINVSAGNITDWKQGRSRPNIDAVVKIADYFNCSVDYLLGRTDVPEVNRRTAKKASFTDKQPANNIIRLAGRDGSMIELKLTDEEASIMQNAITRCDEVGEDDF